MKRIQTVCCSAFFLLLLVGTAAVFGQDGLPASEKKGGDQAPVRPWLSVVEIPDGVSLTTVAGQRADQAKVIITVPGAKDLAVSWSPGRDVLVLDFEIQKIQGLQLHFDEDLRALVAQDGNTLGFHRAGVLLPTLQIIGLEALDREGIRHSLRMSSDLPEGVRTPMVSLVSDTSLQGPFRVFLSITPSAILPLEPADLSRNTGRGSVRAVKTTGGFSLVDAHGAERFTDNQVGDVQSMTWGTLGAKGRQELAVATVAGPARVYSWFPEAGSDGRGLLQSTWTATDLKPAKNIYWADVDDDGHDDLVAESKTGTSVWYRAEPPYVPLANACSQVLWLESQLWDASNPPLAPGVPFTTGTMLNIGDSGLDALLTISQVCCPVEPAVEMGDPTVAMTGVPGAGFQLDFVTGTANLLLENFFDLENFESLLIANNDGGDLTFMQTTPGPGPMLINGVPVPGVGVPVIVTGGATVQGSTPGPGLQWQVGFTGVSGFSWAVTHPAPSPEGFRLFIDTNTAPSVTTNNPLQIALGSTGNTVTTADLEATDAEDSAPQITYTLDGDPADGTLRLSGVVLGLNDTFTQDDIDQNRLTYDHGGNLDVDSFAATITDSCGAITAAPLIYVFEVNRDFGDAPSGYPVTSADDGARHAATGLFLGANRDVETDGTNSTGADDDDTTGSPDDEDGVTFTNTWMSGGTGTLDVVSSSAGLLDAWVDFDQDGNWLDAGEQVFTGEALAAGVNNLNVSIPGGAAGGTTYARFRFSTAGSLAPTGFALDGEVEDHAVAIVAEQPVIGVAKTASVSGSQVTFNFYLENLGDVTISSLALDEDFDAVLGAGNYSIISAPTLIDDPGTLVLNGGFDGSTDTDVLSSGGSSLAASDTAQIRVVIDVTNLTDQGAGLGVYANQVTISGLSPLSSPVSDLSDDGTNPDPNGTGDPTEPGENDATPFTVVQGIDFGDAPDPTYPTLLASNGARHTETGPTLGANRDTESDGQPNATATGDDNAANPDDEDGIAVVGLWKAGISDATVAVTLANADGTSNLLDAWIDFNQDGDWDDAGEQIFTSESLGTSNGTFNVQFAIPGGAVTGDTFARFRLSTAGGLATTGLAADGEVEDHEVTIWTVETSAGLDGNNDMLVQDINGGTSNDDLVVEIIDAGATLLIWDYSLAVEAGTGATQVDANTVSIPIASVTGEDLLVDTLAGNDLLEVDVAGGGGGMSLSISYDGGTQTGSDTLDLSNYTGAMIVTPLNVNDGDIDVTGSPTITYFGLEGGGGTPIQVSSGLSSIQFDFSSVDNLITIDEGGAGTEIASNLGTGVAFRILSGTVTVNCGTGDDEVLLSSIMEGDDFSLVIDGQGGGDDLVEIADGATIDLGAGGLTVDAEEIRLIGNGSVSTTGSGAIALTAVRKILNETGTIQSVGGEIELIANKAGTGTDNFTGIELGNGSSITTTTGTLTLDGTGGDTGNGNIGIHIRPTASVSYTGGGNKTIELTGTGGISSDIFSGNMGILIEGSVNSNRSCDINGTGGGGGVMNNNYGTNVSGTVTATGAILWTSSRTSSTPYAAVVSGTVQSTATDVGYVGESIQILGTGLIKTTGTSIDIQASGTGPESISMLSGAKIESNFEVLLQSDLIDLAAGASVTGSLALYLEPSDANSTIGLGGGAGIFNLTDTELAVLDTGFSEIYVGRNTGTHTITVDTISLPNVIDLYFEGTGSVTDGGATGTDITANESYFGPALQPGASPGQFVVDGTLDFNTGFDVELNGTTAGSGYDQLVLSGTSQVAYLAGTLNVSVGFDPEGDSFTIIDAQDAGSTTDSTFTGLAEGAIVTGSDYDFQISYVGGDGNDVVLTHQGAPTSPTAMVVTKDLGTSVNLTYSAPCFTSGGTVYVGTTPTTIADAVDWNAAYCVDRDGDTTFDPGDPASGELMYFVYVGRTTIAESTYGQDSGSTERPESSGVGACDLPQRLAGAGCV